MSVEVVEPWNVPNAKLGAGAVVLDEDRVLLVQVNYGPAQGKWILPGGRVESGEVLTTAVQREVKEETNVDVEVNNLLAVRQRLMPSGLIDIYFLFRCEVKLVPAQLKGLHPDEIIEARFWNVQTALQDPNVRPMSKLAIRLATQEKSGFQLVPNIPDFAETDFVFA